MSVPNHGFHDYSIVQFFYNGLTNETKQMIDSTAGGSLSELTVEQCLHLFAVRASNDEQYNSDGETEPKKGMLFITPELMPEVNKSMEEKRYSSRAYQRK